MRKKRREETAIGEPQDARPALRLADAFRAYRASAACPAADDRTLSRQEGYFNDFLGWMGENRPETVEARAVTAADAEAYAAQLQERQTAGIFNKQITFLRRLWRVLIEGDEGKGEDADRPELLKAKITGNPWTGIHRKRRGRANGHGTLQKGSSGVFLARWMAGGKRYSRSTGTSERREAEKKLEEFTAPFRLGGEARTLEVVARRIEGVRAEIREWHDSRPALRLADAFEAYRASTLRPDAGERTLSGYESYFNDFLEWMGENRPETVEARAVTAADAEAYAAQFLERNSAGTFNKHMTFLRCLWRVLIEGDGGKSEDADKPELLKAKITDNPWLRIRNRKHTPHARRELTVEELGAVVKSATGEMRLLLALGIYTGLRLGDCALMEWGSVDLVRKLVSVVPIKTARRTGKRVVIPLHETLAGMLDAVPSGKRKGYVLPGVAKDYARDSALVVNRIQALFEGCGIKTGHADEKTGRAVVDVGFHSLRHTFVSLSANAGAPLAVVQSIVGHGSPAMTRHYFHESENALRRVVSALPNVAGDRGRKAVGRTDGSEERLSALRAILEKMNRKELESARKEIGRRLAACKK